MPIRKADGPTMPVVPSRSDSPATLPPKSAAPAGPASWLSKAAGRVASLEQSVAKDLPKLTSPVANAQAELAKVAKSAESLWGGASVTSLTESGLRALGATLPGVGGALLKDSAVSKDIVENPALHGAVQQLTEGRVDTALQTLFGPAAGRDDVARVVAGDSTVMARLAPLGLKSASDLSAVGQGISDALKAGDSLLAGHPADALHGAAGVVRELPAGLRENVIEKLTERLPPGIKEGVRAAVPMIEDPQFDAQMSNAAKAVVAREPGEAVASLARAGQAVATREPKQTVSVLDGLGHLPGSFGGLFQSHELNQQTVESGALTEVFASVEHLAKGDGAGTVSSLGDAGKSLLTYGTPIEIAGFQLPVSQEGAMAMLELTQRVVALTPPEVQAQVQASLGAAGNLVPFVGPALNTAIDGGKVITDVHNKKYDLASLADAGQLLLDIASFSPHLAPMASAGKMMIATATTVGNVVMDAASVKNLFFPNQRDP